MELYNGDCLEKLKDLSDNSVDIIIADPPYARFKHLEWDRKIDFEPLWEQLWRVSKPNTPIFLFADFKFALEIYNSQPKYFKYEIVWNKGTTTTPLLSRKRFGKCTEYILVFYKKQCVYNYAKYHKIIKTSKPKKTKKRAIMKHDSKMEINNTYEPKLPTNIIENEVIEKEEAIRDTWGKIIRYDNNYEPRLPCNVIKCQTKKNKKIIKKLTEKPQFVLEHLLKYFSNEGDTCLDFCMGSGSMGVACNTLNRKFIGIEKNKEFFEITKKRLTSPNII
tara:strand:- start:27 stop:857 length:831 start_codon:yes stop_codon:yes gene_type:complete